VIYIRLDEPVTSAVRVMQRVTEGGHNVPADKILARFPRTAANAQKALEIAALGYMLDNSTVDQPYRWVETWQEGVRVDQDTPGFQPFPTHEGH
jgi:predicted ABC-type ATPase